MKETLAYELRELDSSIIESVLYVERNKSLFIEFKGGAIYEYDEVPLDEYISIKESESKGRYINSIKGNYEYKRVDQVFEENETNK